MQHGCHAKPLLIGESKSVRNCCRTKMVLNLRNLSVMNGMRRLTVCDYRINFHAKWCLESVLNVSSLLIQVELNLSPDALKLSAKKALEKKTGARGLRAILVRTQSNC